MLKRRQVLIKDWQVEAIVNIAAGAKISISEAVRYMINQGLLLSGKYYEPSKEARDKAEFEARKAADSKLI